MRGNTNQYLGGISGSQSIRDFSGILRTPILRNAWDKKVRSFSIFGDEVTSLQDSDGELSRVQPLFDGK